MSLISRFLNVFRAASLERELDDELRFHLERRIQSLVERGLGRAEAETQAHRQFGSVARAKRAMQEERVMNKRVAGTIAVMGVLALGVFVWSTQQASLELPAPPQIADTRITTPSLLHEVKPRYTPEALKARVKGMVTLGCVVQTDGACGDIRVTKSLDDAGLDREAIKALEQWRFKPGTRGGKPVPVEVSVEMAFNLK